MNHFQSPECVNWPLSDAEIKETKGKSNIFWLRSRSDQKVRKTWSEKWKEEARRSSQLFQNRFRRSSAIFGDKCSTKIIRNISALLWDRFFILFWKISKNAIKAVWHDFFRTFDSDCVHFWSVSSVSESLRIWTTTSFGNKNKYKLLWWTPLYAIEFRLFRRVSGSERLCSVDHRVGIHFLCKLFVHEPCPPGNEKLVDSVIQKASWPRDFGYLQVGDNNWYSGAVQAFWTLNRWQRNYEIIVHTLSIFS